MDKNDVKGKVYCIVDKRTKALFEVCATKEVAFIHAAQSIYVSLGLETEIVERVIWVK